LRQHAARLASALTSNGEEYDNKVEDVPRFFEVVAAQCEQLEDALEREDGNEDLVDVRQSAGNRVRLSMVLGRHDGTQPPYRHDGTRPP